MPKKINYKYVPYDLVCQECWDTFHTFDNKRKYCDKCMDKEHIRKTIGLYIIKCIQCDRLFSTNRKNQKTCSPECRKYIAANERGAHIKKYWKWKIFERDNFTCFYCGRNTFEDGIKLNTDHVISRNLKGDDFAANIVTACTDCNGTKGKYRLNSKIEKEILKEVERRNKECGLNPKTIIYEKISK